MHYECADESIPSLSGGLLSLQCAQSGFAEICDTLDLLHSELCEKLYSERLLAQRIQDLTGTSCPGVLHDGFDSSEYGITDRLDMLHTCWDGKENEEAGEDVFLFLEDFRSPTMRMLSKLRGAAEFVSSHSESFQSAEEALAVYECAFHTEDVHDQCEKNNAVEKFFPQGLVCPTMPIGAPLMTTVVVRFMDTDNEQDVSGWSTFVLVWPFGRFAETKATSLDPPRMGAI